MPERCDRTLQALKQIIMEKIYRWGGPQPTPPPPITLQGKECIVSSGITFNVTCNYRTAEMWMLRGECYKFFIQTINL
jgi:hypothetical protein